jgi:hypothetical protein
MNGHEQVVTCPIGCRTVKELDEVIDSALEEIPKEILEEFHSTFDL